MTTAAADATVPRILPRLDDRNRPFWTGGREGRLLILRERGGGRWVHPPERVAPEAAHLSAEPVSGRGSVFTFTVNHHRYHPDVPVPYVIALVELDEQPGLRLPANIVDCAVEDVHIGMRVQVAFEDHGEVFVPVFKPESHHE
jgi:uncharacterized protein